MRFCVGSCWCVTVSLLVARRQPGGRRNDPNRSRRGKTVLPKGRETLLAPAIEAQKKAQTSAATQPGAVPVRGEASGWECGD